MSQEINLTVSTEGLTALSEMAIATKDQTKLDDLLARNAEAQLSIEEQKELDRLLSQWHAHCWPHRRGECHD